MTGDNQLELALPTRQQARDGVECVSGYLPGSKWKQAALGA